MEQEIAMDYILLEVANQNNYSTCFSSWPANHIVIWNEQSCVLRFNLYSSQWSDVTRCDILTWLDWVEYSCVRANCNITAIHPLKKGSWPAAHTEIELHLTSLMVVYTRQQLCIYGLTICINESQSDVYTDVLSSYWVHDWIG